MVSGTRSEGPDAYPHRPTYRSGWSRLRNRLEFEMDLPPPKEPLAYAGTHGRFLERARRGVADPVGRLSSLRVQFMSLSVPISNFLVDSLVERANEKDLRY
ncbi:hypothetical protein OPV22_013187 [Ensete ventricosum]|uniref:Uncharacterized protein n=1 Tax=Ensete ventricosum TaxID=4639 RepID=A0AAV8R3A6_ENSVE|nr:hypothetical protein OPV22_013187 [Ensete ventricosum]